MFKQFGFLCVSIVAIAGCNPVSSVDTPVNTASTAQQESYPAMAVPLQPNALAENNIAELTQLLSGDKVKAADKAQIYLDRGRSYDSMGLRDLARMDYFKSLEINPRQADVYNLLGMYYTQIGKFDTAYQAFDSTIELDPSNLSAVFNRAVAQYYGKRPDLALEDMRTYYESNPSDPFSALWLYIIESELDKNAALTRLKSTYENKTDQWEWMLVGIILNEVSEEDVSNYIVNSTANNTIMAQKFTEAYFYLGKNYMANGDIKRALCVYKLALSLNVFNFSEHSYALLELDRISDKFKSASKNGKQDKFVYR